ncbi:uncharacterized protein LOC111604401 isoform X2 [Drosophila hydei]|nr:uncharacterized protein LOC111604401 isoform X2 [Drosophila hydei]
MIDYRQIDAELARIQFEYDNMNMAHYGLFTDNNKLPDMFDHCCDPEPNLMDSALKAEACFPTAIQAPPRYMNFRQAGASRANPIAAEPVQRRQQARDLAEMSYNLPPSTMITGSQVISLADEPALLPVQIMSSTPKSPVLQQEVNRLESDVVTAPQSEPYKCPVCLKCVHHRKPASTVCGHVFCSSCIKTALRATCKCPVCQRLITARQIFRIFI